MGGFRYFVSFSWKNKVLWSLIMALNSLSVLRLPLCTNQPTVAADRGAEGGLCPQVLAEGRRNWGVVMFLDTKYTKIL